MDDLLKRIRDRENKIYDDVKSYEIKEDNINKILKTLEKDNILEEKNEKKLKEYYYKCVLFAKENNIEYPYDNLDFYEYNLDIYDNIIFNLLKFFSKVHNKYIRLLDPYDYKFLGCKCPFCKEYIDEKYQDNNRCPECETKIILSIADKEDITLETKDEDIYVCFEMY